VYLLCTLLGVAGMIFASDVATKVGCGSGVGRPRKRSSSNAKLSLTPTTAPVWSQSWWEGVGASVFAGIFAAVQFSAVTLGKRHEQRSAGCTWGLCAHYNVVVVVFWFFSARARPLIIDRWFNFDLFVTLALALAIAHTRTARESSGSCFFGRGRRTRWGERKKREAVAPMTCLAKKN